MVVHFLLFFLGKSMQGRVVVSQEPFQIIGSGHGEGTEFHRLQVAEAFYGHVVGGCHDVVVVAGVS